MLEMFLQHLGERPVRDPASVREAAPGTAQGFGSRTSQPLPELAHEPGLAHARIADIVKSRDSPRLSASS